MPIAALRPRRASPSDHSQSSARPSHSVLPRVSVEHHASMSHEMTSSSNVLLTGEGPRTALLEALGSPPAEPAPTPTALLQRARWAFLKRQRVELSLLAGEIGVSRGTVHRWAGSREQLLGE